MAVGVQPDELARFADLQLRELYTDAICGGALLAMGGSPGGLERAEAPLAFQSALAGVLLAAELVIDATDCAGNRWRRPRRSTSFVRSEFTCHRCGRRPKPVRAFARIRITSPATTGSTGRDDGRAVVCISAALYGTLAD